MYLVFDIGGTNMRFAASDDGQTVKNIHILPTPQDFAQALQEIKKLKGSVFSENFLGAGGSAPGPINREKTELVNAPNLPGWIGKPLARELEAIFGCPVVLENDAALAGLGEAHFGAGKGKNIVAYFTISTGVGGAKIVDGTIVRNFWGMEPGQQIMSGEGGEETLENLVSGTALEKRYGKKSSEIQDPKIWDEVARILAQGLHNSIIHWSPEVVILGGSVMKSLPLESVRKHLQKIMRIFPRIPEIRLAKLGDASALYGALALLKNK